MRRKISKKDEVLGAEIRKLREEKEVSQTEVADKLEISQAQYQKNEAGLNRFSFLAVALIARLLSFKLDDLARKIEKK